MSSEAPVVAENNQAVEQMAVEESAPAVTTAAMEQANVETSVSVDGEKPSAETEAKTDTAAILQGGIDENVEKIIENETSELANNKKPKVETSYYRH